MYSSQLWSETCNELCHKLKRAYYTTMMFQHELHVLWLILLYPPTMKVQTTVFLGVLALLVAVVAASAVHRVADLHPSAVAGFRIGRGIYDITGPAAEGIFS